MAKLPKIEIKAHWARDELHKGNREKGLALLAETGDGPIARELREKTAPRRGRPPFGASHRWWDIGIDNDELTVRGWNREDRLKELGAAYMLNPRQIETALAKYNRAVDEIQAIEEENRDR